MDLPADLVKRGGSRSNGAEDRRHPDRSEHGDAVWIPAGCRFIIHADPGIPREGPGRRVGTFSPLVERPPSESEPVDWDIVPSLLRQRGGLLINPEVFHQKGLIGSLAIMRRGMDRHAA